jgi:type I restriction enzyme S subunit
VSEKKELDGFDATEDSAEQKETPIDELPSEWGVGWLNDVVSINSDGFSEDDWPSETFEYISLSEASNGKIERSETVPLEEAPSRAQRTVRQGDVLVGTVRPKQRSHGFVSAEHDGKICSSGFGVLRTGPNLNSRYLSQEILSHRFFSQMEAYVAGSGYPAVKISDLKKHRVSVPPLPEQRKIATVLYNVDQAIQKTEEIIEQIKKVKKATIQDLFKFGLQEGKSRSPDDLESEFRKTPIGYIPKSWECVRIGRIIEQSDGFIQTGPFGSQLHKDEYVDDGIPVVMPQNIENGEVSTEEIAEITPEKADDLDRHRMNKNDVIIARRGDLKRASSVSDREDGWLCGTGCLLIRPPSDKINARWLQIAYQHPSSQDQINSRAVGSTMSNLNQSILENLQLALPPVSEQKAIVNIVSKIEQRITVEESYYTNLQRLKRGLMQDLLSGEVRTTDADIAVPETITQHG